MRAEGEEAAARLSQVQAQSARRAAFAASFAARNAPEPAVPLAQQTATPLPEEASAQQRAVREPSSFTSGEVIDVDAFEDEEAEEETEAPAPAASATPIANANVAVVGSVPEAERVMSQPSLLPPPSSPAAAATTLPSVPTPARGSEPESIPSPRASQQQQFLQAQAVAAVVAASQAQAQATGDDGTISSQALLPSASPQRATPTTLSTVGRDAQQQQSSPVRDSSTAGVLSSILSFFSST
jgi:hypothetical protein